MALSGKHLASLIVAKHAAPAASAGVAAGAPEGGEAEGAASPSELEIASTLIEAIAAKDPNAVAAALKAYCELHEAGEPGEGEPDGDEGYSPAE